MKLLREPLLHFLLAGAGLFLAYAWVNPGAETQEGDDQRVIRIGEGDVRWASETWTRQWQRNPTRDELRGMVREMVREELLAREAREMELDRDDTIVRRRLAQKMTFLIEDASLLAEPTEDELRQFYEAHPERFRREASVSFSHVFFDSAKRPSAAADARKALLELTGTREQDLEDDIGDRSLIEAQLVDADESAVSARFGEDFSRALFALAPGEWQGPVESAYGLHLVRLIGRTPAAQRPFDEVKEEAREAFREQRRQAGMDRYFAELLKKYRIVTDDKVTALVGSLQAEQAQ